MALVRSPAPPNDARQAGREIVLWTTKDGREIPLDDMSDDHIANAVRVLSLWRSRLKKQGNDDPIVKELAATIARFKLIERQRRKAAARATPPKATKKTGRQSSSRFAARTRKPVAST